MIDTLDRRLDTWSQISIEERKSHTSTKRMWRHFFITRQTVSSCAEFLISLNHEIQDNLRYAAPNTAILTKATMITAPDTWDIIP